ncbi:MAG: hypothetical protein HDT47_05960 [Ruminococcaceae bacterium]|nr:hypothetical protein [Oscillospiraceae bacterium]
MAASTDYRQINQQIFIISNPRRELHRLGFLYNGDEIAAGLDPNNPTTFGVPDAEYKLEQTISTDSEVRSEINTEEAPYELSLEISASGNAEKNLTADSSMYFAATESCARVGEAVNFSYFGGEIDKVKLVYEINDEYVYNDDSEYAENCLDLQGIKRYNIFRYFDELNMLLPVTTQFDEENNTLYAETDELGTYCLLDMEILLQQLNIALDGETFEAAARPMLLAASEEDIEEYCVTFIFDIRKGKITSEQLKKMKDEVSHFAGEAFAFNPNTSIRLLTQNVSDFDGENFNVICDSAVTLDEVNTALDKIKISGNSGVFGDYCIISEALAMWLITLTFL